VQGFLEYVRNVWLSPLPLKLVYGAFIAGAFELIYVMTGRMIRRALAPALRADATRDPSDRVRRRRFVLGPPLALNRWLWYSIALLMILRVFGLPISAELLPMLAIAIAVTLVIGKNLFRDLLAGWLITYEDRYSPGDRVAIGEDRGVVTEMTLRTTTIRTHGGREIVFRNSQVQLFSNEGPDQGA